MEGLTNKRVPKHVAIIMDGNGRWAKARNKERTFGHKNSTQSVKEAIETCIEAGIKHLTLFLFSNENWHRPKQEISVLMELFGRTLKRDSKELMEKDIVLRVIGRLERLSSTLTERILKLTTLTKNNNTLFLTLALSYGAKEEICDAMKKIGNDIKENLYDSEQIDNDLIQKKLYNKDLPDVDLLIRTGGEYRLSNFLIWQAAYAELYFTNVFWPDFRKAHFIKAIEEYQNRERRFGKISKKSS